MRSDLFDEDMVYVYTARLGTYLYETGKLYTPVRTWGTEQDFRPRLKFQQQKRGVARKFLKLEKRL